MSDSVHTPNIATRRDDIAANAVPLPALSELAHRRAEQTAALLKRLFQSFNGALCLRLWSGITLQLGNAPAARTEPRFTLVCRNPGVVRSMIFGRDRLRLAEAYFRGDLDIEGDFFAALGLKDHLNDIRLCLRDRLITLLGAARLGASVDMSPSPPLQRESLHGWAHQR